MKDVNIGSLLILILLSLVWPKQNLYV